MPRRSNKCSEFKHTSRADENGTCANDCRGKPNSAKLLLKFIRVALFQFSNKSVVEHNFGTNYFRRPRFHYIYIYHHHHHHVTLVARISLTLSRHSSLSFIAPDRSSGQHPVSLHSCWIYVRAGRPAFARPCVGVHKSTSLMSSSLLIYIYLYIHTVGLEYDDSISCTQSYRIRMII